MGLQAGFHLLAMCACQIVPAHATYRERVTVLRRGLHHLAGAQVGDSSPYLSRTSAQVRITTMRYVDALKSLTYAFLLGQRMGHQPGGALRDAALTALTCVALPGLVLVCLEACPLLQQPSLVQRLMHLSLCKH